MTQPAWKYETNLGDASPLEHGGKFLYVDATGVYPPELEVLEEPCEDDKKETYTIYRFSIDQCKIAEVDGRKILIPFGYDANWPHPVEDYEEWFSRDLDGVAAFTGEDIDKLRENFCSDDIKLRAMVHIDLGQYYGFSELDHCPSQLTWEEVKERYKNGELG